MGIISDQNVPRCANCGGSMQRTCSRGITCGWRECPECHGNGTYLAAAAGGEPFDKRCADALADEVAVLVRRRVIDMRSPAADALLDYRNPPSSPRADRLAKLDAAWQLVPLEPTDEMKEAWSKYRDDCAATGKQKTAGGHYRAMLAAAPKPPAQAQESAAARDTAPPYTASRYGSAEAAERAERAARHGAEGKRAHECWDWDGLVIHPGDVEMDACTCLPVNR